MTDELCYLVVSKISGEEIKVHGIFTQEYLENNMDVVDNLIGKLKKRSDFQSCFILPMNHAIEKGMIV